MNTIPFDNRQAPRALTSLSCVFGLNEATTRNGMVTSLSTKGCFIKTKAVAVKDQTLFLNLRLSDEQQVLLKATVIYHINDIGFGLLFTEKPAEDQRVLDEFMERALSSKS